MTEEYEGPEMRAGGGLEDGDEDAGGFVWENSRSLRTASVRPPDVFERTDGRGTFYRGKVNAIVGEPEGGKSLIAQAVVVSELNAGERVAYLDHEDDGVTVAERIISLGADPDAFDERFHYMEPGGSFAGKYAGRFFDSLRDLAPSLIVVDGLTKAMQGQGLNLNDNSDASAIFDMYLDRLANTGAAVVVIHHVTKSNDGRGTYGLGAVMLKGLIRGAQYGVEVDNKQRHAGGQSGRSFLVIHKDSPSGVRYFADGDRWATFTTASTATGESNHFGRALFRTTWELAPPGAGLENGPTGCMEAISRWLEAYGEAASERDILSADLSAGFTERTRKKAVQKLVDDGYVVKGTGKKAYVHAAQYREPAEG